MGYCFTAYFEHVVLAKRPSITWGMCIRVAENPLRVDIDQASTYLDLRTVDLRNLPFEPAKVAG